MAKRKRKAKLSGRSAVWAEIDARAAAEGITADDLVAQHRWHLPLSAPDDASALDDLRGKVTIKRGQPGVPDTIVSDGAAACRLI